MRIIIISINYSPELTGCGPYASDLASALAQQGHEVRVLCGMPHYPDWKVPTQYKHILKSISVINGINVTRLWHWVPRRYSALGRILYEITFGIHALLHSLNIRGDICLTISPSLLSGLAGILHKKRGARLKILVQDLISPAARLHASNLPFFIHWAINMAEKFFLTRADDVGIIHKSFLPRILDYGVQKKRVLITENYSLIEQMHSTYEQARKKWGWNNTQKIVLYTGSIGEKQNLDNLIFACDTLKDIYPDVKVVIVGNGPKKNALIELAKDLPNIEFREFVSTNEYPDLLAAADLLVAHEGQTQEAIYLQSKLQTYLSTSRPILVVSSQTSPSRQFAIEKHLYFCEAGNPRLLSNAIVNALKSEYIGATENRDSGEARKKRVNWVMTK